MKHKEQKKGKHLNQQQETKQQETKRRQFNHIFQEALLSQEEYWHINFYYNRGLNVKIVTQRHFNMGIIIQFSHVNELSCCLTSTLIEQESKFPIFLLKS